MKKIILFSLSISFCLITNAQNLKNPGDYIGFIDKQYREVMKDFMSYSSGLAHSKNARKVENKRKELIRQTKESAAKVAKMPAFEGDKSLRDSAAATLNLTHKVLTHDFEKIVNMEEIAEQSYDAMEAYLAAQEAANTKLDEANDRVEAEVEKFAKAHNVTLMQDTKDELSKKVKKTTAVNKYYEEIFLIFFKSFKQEVYLLDAIQKKDVNAIEQNKNTLTQFADEGLKKLEGLKGFNNSDKSLITSCKQVLQFYKSECTDKIGIYTNYFLKEENFEKVKKAFDAKKPNERNKESVDEYNKAVNEMNAASTQFNSANSTLNQNRTKVTEGWNNAVSNFMDKHVPKYKQ